MSPTKILGADRIFPRYDVYKQSKIEIASLSTVRVESEDIHTKHKQSNDVLAGKLK